MTKNCKNCKNYKFGKCLIFEDIYNIENNDPEGYIEQAKDSGVLKEAFKAILDPLFEEEFINMDKQAEVLEDLIDSTLAIAYPEEPSIEISLVDDYYCCDRWD